MKKIKLLFLLVALNFCSKLSIATNNDTLIVNPNPFDSITVIHFEITNNDTIWLNVFNSNGNTIKTYFNGTVLPNGSYSFNFNGDTLPNGIYFVTLKINSTKTLTVKLIKSQNIVGLKENILFKKNSIYPNPTNSLLNIYDNNLDLLNTKITITNNLGEVVLSINYVPQIDISTLKNGMYYLMLNDNSNKIVVKIIKE